MQGDDAGGQFAAARARDLQPSGQLGPQNLGAPVSEDDLRQLSGRHSREARQLQQSIDRRMSDQRILEVLARDGFEGSRYDRFVEELVRYGISVLRGWMHSGFIFHLVADRGFGLNPHELDLEELASNSDLREELATMTVARALPRFRQRALIEGGWTYEGGASITTYFMGACAYDFPNEFRRYRAGEERQSRALHRQQELYEDPISPLSVAAEVHGNLEVLERLRVIKDPRTRATVALTVDGYSQEEIRQILDAKSVRAVEGMLYRWRSKEKREREEGDQHGQPPRR
ncbi:hypothetical protein DIZ27_41300 [Streptomyces sp. NWU339]|uniref:hypothetical protein n=1 Tax=Streptomyces sp. NWU339 TaxID=2185284 RepID=UPI000D67B86B|nr:hypothetical protein [Streptomyces sp. NWU339]PWI05116.1 hypothetical protein DIZ27_41300 [Streptomyces sp. NWU339]